MPPVTGGLSAAPAALLSAVLFGHFALIGAFSPFLALYLADRRFTVEAITVLMTVPQVMRIVAPPFWGRLADRSGQALALLRAGAAGSLLCLMLLSIAQGLFWPVFACLAALTFCMGAHGPILESMSLQLAAGDAGRYGRLRIWGSIGFLLSVVLCGIWLERIGIAVLPWLCATMAAASLVLLWLLPARRTSGAPRRGLGVRRRLREPALIGFFVAAFLMIAAHASLYAFLSLFLERHGYNRAEIGALWAVGVLAEIGLFWWQRRVFARFPAASLLRFSMWIAVLRFGLVGLSGGHPAIIVPAQLMHAVTFGVHHSAVMGMLHHWFGPERQASAQAVYSGVGYGLGGAVGTLAGGWLWTTWSPASVFIGAAVAAALGAWALAWCARHDYPAASR